MQQLVWGHKENLNSIDGRSCHGAGRKLRLLSIGAKESRVTGREGRHGGEKRETWTRRRRRPSRAKGGVRPDGRRSLQLLSCCLQPQVHCGKHKGTLSNTGVPHVQQSKEQPASSIVISPLQGEEMFSSPHTFPTLSSFSSLRSGFLLNPVEPTKHQHENAEGMLEPQCTGGSIHWSTRWQNS